MIQAERIHCADEVGVWPDAEPRVVYNDNHLLVLLKPFNLPCQPDESGDASLVEWARSWVQTRYDKPGAAWIGLLHRLDRPAAGLVALARTSKAATRLSGQFRRRTAGRLYLARVHGRPAGEGGRLVHHLLKDTAQRRSRVVPPGQGQEAILDWRLVDIATEPGSQGRRPVSELEILLGTGRPHQIRAQLAAVGHPLLGDLKYGAPDPLPGRNIALFARELELAHPVGGRRLRFVAEAPLRWMTAAGGTGR
jgi:23S rRNA pseudouridine1911/1915/1917 synthase